MQDRIRVDVQRADGSEPRVRAADAIASEDESDDLLKLLYRKKVFDRDLPAFVEGALQTGRPLGLLMVDLDDFKAVNDQHGHQVGNEVLIGCSEIIAARIEGKGGRAYRLSEGADEFPILLPNFSVMESEAVAETLRKAIESSTLSSKALKVTVSIGVACLPDHANDADSLFRGIMYFTSSPKPCIIRFR